MKEQIQQRLESLKEEFASGQKFLIDLETKQASVRETLLRISGAIQVLEEELDKVNGDANNQVTTQPVLAAIDK